MSRILRNGSGYLLAVLGTLLTPAIAQAITLTSTLDWNAVDWIGGSLAGSFSFGSDRQIGMSFSGNTNRLVSGTPDDTTVLNGTLTSNETLRLQADFANSSELVTLRSDFIGFDALQNVSFTLYDIDKSNNSTAASSWQDRIVLRGFRNGVEVLPTFQISNPANISQVGSNTLDGIRSVDNEQDGGNVRVTFGETIDYFTLTFTQNPALSLANPSSHGIGIGNIQFSHKIPEPSSVLSLLTLGSIGIGAVFKGRKKRQ